MFIHDELGIDEIVSFIKELNENGVKVVPINKHFEKEYLEEDGQGSAYAIEVEDSSYFYYTPLERDIDYIRLEKELDNVKDNVNISYRFLD